MYHHTIPPYQQLYVYYRLKINAVYFYGLS